MPEAEAILGKAQKDSGERKGPILTPLELPGGLRRGRREREVWKWRQRTIPGRFHLKAMEEDQRR